MAVASFPASGGGGLASEVKSLQTGTASSSGTITITAVNTAKTFVYATSTGSAGTVAASGSINAANGSTSGISFSAAYGSIDNYMLYNQGNANFGYGSYGQQGMSASGNYTFYASNRYSGVAAATYAAVNQFMNAMNTNGMNVGLNATSLTGGTTSGLYSASYGATLTNSTTITVTGPCNYQVIEYY